MFRHWYSIALSNLWLNRSHHVCIRRPDRLCSFQPRCMLMPLSASLVGFRFMLWTCTRGSCFCFFLSLFFGGLFGCIAPQNCFHVGCVPRFICLRAGCHTSHWPGLKQFDYSAKIQLLLHSGAAQFNNNTKSKRFQGITICKPTTCSYLKCSSCLRSFWHKDQQNLQEYYSGMNPFPLEHCIIIQFENKTTSLISRTWTFT